MKPANFSPQTLFSLRELLENETKVLKFKKGQVIYTEESTPLGFYYIDTGKVKIYKRGIDGKEQIMRIGVADEIISPSELISGSRFISSAAAMEDTVLLFLPKVNFMVLMKEQKGFCEYIMNFISNEFIQVQAKIVDIAYKPVRERVADSLLYLNTKLNKNQNSTMSLNISRSDLAGYVGTTRETLNRFISEFRKDLFIMTEGRRINIVNPKGLSSISKRNF